jgi:leucyl aminopeptidase
MLTIGFSTSVPKTAKAVIVTATQKPDLLAGGKALDKKTGNALGAALKVSGFKGKKKEIERLTGYSKAAENVFFLGLGDKTGDLKTADFEAMGGALVKSLNAAKVKKAVVALDSVKGVDIDEMAAHIAMGMVLTSYRFDKYRTREEDDKKPTLTEVTFALQSAPEAKARFAPLQKAAEGVFLTRDLMAEPANELYPEVFANRVKKELGPLGVKVKILNESQMKKLGMGSLLSVGHGSIRDSRCVIMEWNGAPKATGKDKQPLALVGKGITFDTGGISLKPGAGMWDMKFDMGGAGAVVGAMKSLAGRKAKANVVAVIALAENMPSDRATRPGDVVKSMSGQTIEVLNTDAEGRLVLADALTYVQKKHNPRLIVDLATLTGAIIVALGHEFAGAFTNDDELGQQMMAAGKTSGDAVWQMPMTETWDKDMDSDIADMRNIHARGDAGSACAAAFLQRFVEKDMKWLHLDIAGVAWTAKERPTGPKGATGYGVRLLDQFVRDIAEG